jgi:hypothetical protein
MQPNKCAYVMGIQFVIKVQAITATDYRSIFYSWQLVSGDLHAAPFPPIGFVTAARSRDPIKRI